MPPRIQACIGLVAILVVLILRVLLNADPFYEQRL